MTICPNGHENLKGQHFCGECGAALITKSPQQGDESKSVKRPDKSAAESLALAEAEVEVAEAEAAAAAARARVVRLKNIAYGLQPVAKLSTPKPRQQSPPKQPISTGGPAIKKQKVWPWVLLAAFVLFFGGCTALLISGSHQSNDLVLDKDGTYYHIDRSGTWAAGSARSGDCTWIRQSKITGPVEDGTILGAGTVAPGQTKRVKLQRGEYFSSNGCLPWHYVG